MGAVAKPQQYTFRVGKLSHERERDGDINPHLRVQVLERGADGWYAVGEIEVHMHGNSRGISFGGTQIAYAEPWKVRGPVLEPGGH